MDRNSLDPYAILKALEVTGPEQIVPVFGGADTAIWRITLHGQVSALRVFRAEQAACVVRECAAMEAVRATGLPVPEIQAKGIWQDRPAMLISWCPGRSLLQILNARPAYLLAYGHLMGQALARIHRIEAPAALRSERASWIDYIGDAEPELRHALQTRADLRTDALLHLDFHPLNLLVDGRRVAGIIDWTNTQAGDPRADYARTVAILRLTPLPRKTAPALTLTGRRLLELGVRSGYRPHGSQLTGMAAFHAWAAATIERDWRPRLSSGSHFVRTAHMTHIRNHIRIWKRKAGIV